MTVNQFIAVLSAFCIHVAFAQSEKCNVHIQQDSGTFASPKYPASESEKISCQWNITTITGQSFILKLTSKLAEESANCDSRLKIYQISDKGLIFERMFCNGRMDYPFIAMGYRFAIVYETDLSGGVSIQMSFTSGKRCGGNINTIDHSKDIELPENPAYFALETKCFWNIKAPKGSFVQITVRQLLMETSPTCSNGSLRLTDEADKSKTLWETCTSGSHPIKTFQTNEVGVTFTLNSLIPSGLIISYDPSVQSPTTIAEDTTTDIVGKPSPSVQSPTTIAEDTTTDIVGKPSPTVPTISSTTIPTTTSTNNVEKTNRTPLIIGVGMIVPILGLCY